jgi:hypothetical protein
LLVKIGASAGKPAAAAAMGTGILFGFAGIRAAKNRAQAG